MHILSIEASTSILSLAVSKDDKVISYRNVRLRRPLSSSIIPAIKTVLRAADIRLYQIDGFAVGLGPGSFTSLRVGLSTVKGLAMPLNKPVVGIGSLDILAMGVGNEKAWVVTLVDAKRNLVYAGCFEKQKDGLVRKGPYRLTEIRHALKGLKGEIVFTGDGVQVFKRQILKAQGIVPIWNDEELIFPQARYLAGLAAKRFHNDQCDHIDSLLPIYLYPDDCQVRQNLLAAA